MFVLGNVVFHLKVFLSNMSLLLFLHEVNFLCFNFKCNKHNLHLKENILVSSIFKCERRSWGQNIWEPLPLLSFCFSQLPTFSGVLRVWFNGDFLVAGSLFWSGLPLYSLAIYLSPPPPPPPSLSTPAIDFYPKRLRFKFF